MPVTVSKPAFNLREALNSLRRKMGLKGAELLRAETASDVHALINPVMFRNRIINGAMVIDQRNAGGSVSNGAYAVDRWQTVLTAVSGLTTSSQRTNDVPLGSGFTNSYRVTITAAATSHDTNGRCGILQRIEGYNFADAGFGSGSARPITISFWVKASVAGMYSIGLLNNDSTRAFPATYSINYANTWEFKTITVPGETSGTWLTTDGRGLQLEFCLGANASRLGTANTWNSSFVTGATGTTLITNTVNATFNLTGVQVEIGSVATPFERRSFATELQLCQRYYFVVQTHRLLGIVLNGNTLQCPSIIFPVQMRSSPTAAPITGEGGITTAGNWGIYGATNGWGASAGYTPTFETRVEGSALAVASVSGVTDRQGYLVSGGVTFNAEM